MKKYSGELGNELHKLFYDFLIENNYKNTLHQ